MKRMACVLALATGTGLGLSAASLPVLAEPTPTAAASGLQIAIVASGVATSDQNLVLEVSYRNGNIGSIALYIDGVLLDKKLLATHGAHGVIRFELEPSLLSAGEHEVLIKATDLDGNTATATTRLRMTPDDGSGPVRLLSPKRNATVQGVVPIEIQLDETIRKPFVSFFADNDFLELSNYAPFTYNWDSTRYTNGPHTISIDILDGETQEKVKTLTFRVNVNNPGGLTNRQLTTPDLRKKPVTTPVQRFNRSVASAARSAAPQAQFEAPDLAFEMGPIGNAIADAMRSNAAGIAPGNSGMRHSAGTNFGSPFVVPNLDAGNSAKGSPTRPGSFIADHSVPPAYYGGTVVSRPGLLAVFATPKDFLRLSHEGLTGRHITHVSVRPRRAGNIAALPGMGPESSPMAVSTVRVVAVPSLRRVASERRTLVGPGAVTGHGRSLQIAFDNTQIAFDVPPRVEHGLPLAPFRQIFEHTGGTVQWFGHSKTVRAFNSTREIVFRVGHRQATVNNQPLQMAARPYIDRGRTIVPLSFVRDALDVTVQYDAATGHIRIESKK